MKIEIETTNMDIRQIEIGIVLLISLYEVEKSKKVKDEAQRNVSEARVEPVITKAREIAGMAKGSP